LSAQCSTHAHLHFFQVQRFAGTIYGFPAMELMLKRQGFFKSESENGVIQYNVTRLNLIMSVATATIALASTPIGWLVDAKGPMLPVSLVDLLPA
jgi:hypothetical protein